jgi:orotate phosphoribosyltransferase
MSEQARVDAVARELFRIGALKLGDFVLSSGKRSRYYLDLRLVPSDVKVYPMVLDAYIAVIERIGRESFDALAGVATAGITVSSPLALLMKKPMVYVRSEAKGHGLGRSLEGYIERGSRVLVVDDLATTGESMAEAVERVRREGCIVTDATVLIDRQEGAGSRLAELGVRLSSFATVEEVVRSLRRQGMLRESEVETILGRRPGRGGAGGARV